MVSPNLPQLPFAFAKRHGVLLSADKEQDHRTVFTQQPISLSLFSELRRFSQADLSIVEISSAEFQKTMADLYETDTSTTKETIRGIGDEFHQAAGTHSIAGSISEATDLLEQEDEAPIIRLINAILSEAIQGQASDIHLETYQKNFYVRFRIDGILKEIAQPPRALANLIISRIKVMAELNIAEKRIPQDGRMSLKLGGREVDVRVSTLPSVHGERLVLRLLDKQEQSTDLSTLGMDHSDRVRILELLSLSHGILLVTGPTGSGKTTTLYASLNHINDRRKNILTVEDPVEYHIDGIGQTQVNNKAGMTFARGLRAILRQDPDVLMVGEIRDLETMQIAVQASLTGHLVLSTLHTNSAAGAVTRLMDMGVEPFLLSSSLVGILAQRLVRKLCPECKQAHKITEVEKRLFEGLNNSGSIYQANPEGCDHCHQEGYKERTGIYELIVINDQLRELIHDRASQASLIKQVRTDSSSIRQNGYKKVLSGETSLAEVLRVTQED